MRDIINLEVYNNIDMKTKLKEITLFKMIERLIEKQVGLYIRTKVLI